MSLREGLAPVELLCAKCLVDSVEVEKGLVAREEIFSSTARDGFED